MLSLRYIKESKSQRQVQPDDRFSIRRQTFTATTLVQIQAQSEQRVWHAGTRCCRGWCAVSIEAVAWALKSTISKSTKKFVLVCMANYSDEHGRCWPALSTLARDTAQDIKTVRANVRELAEDGYLEDTGKRVGQTQSVVVYRLRVGSHTNIGSLQPTENRTPSPTKNGTDSYTNIGTASGTEALPKTDAKPYQKREGNPTKNGSEALPKLVGRTVMEPSMNRQRNRQYPADAGLMEKLEQVKRVYPKRAGSQPWGRAASAIRARLKDGHQFQAMLEGLDRYRNFCERTNKIRTEAVLQAATFFGPELHFQQDWELPATKAEIKQQTNISAAQAFIDEMRGNHAAE